MPISHIVFSVYDLLKEVEEAGVGVQLRNDKSITGMLFADDFGVSDSGENLQLMWCIIIVEINPQLMWCIIIVIRWRLKG